MTNHHNGYDVGYRKPPKARQFKKGQSGNPKGRPKKINSITEVNIKILNRHITINGPDGPEKVSLAEGALMKMAYEGVKNAKDAQRFIESLIKLESIKDRKAEQEPQIQGGVLAVTAILLPDEWAKATAEAKRPYSSS